MKTNQSCQLQLLKYPLITSTRVSAIHSLFTNEKHIVTHSNPTSFHTANVYLMSVHCPGCCLPAILIVGKMNLDLSGLSPRLQSELNTQAVRVNTALLQNTVNL